MEGVKIVPAGDAAALLVLGDEMSIEMSNQVHALDRAISDGTLVGIRDVVPAYCTLLVHFDPFLISLEEIQARANQVLQSGLAISAAQTRMRDIPIVYGGAYGPDLSAVAEQLQMPEEEIVRLHSGAVYTVCTLGFAPGQPYVVGLPSQLALPRRQNPREIVPTGAVTIANQTNVYPMPNPTGWWWIGRSPIKLFDPYADEPTYLLPGDQMRFIIVSEEEYLSMGGVPMVQE